MALPTQSPEQGPEGGRGLLLTPTGGAFTSMAVTLAGGLVDLLFSGRLGWLFAVTFVAGSVLVSARIRRADLIAGLIIPPYAFALTAFVASLLSSPKSPGDWIVQHVTGLAAIMTINAPVLLAGTAAAGTVVVVRGRRRVLRYRARRRAHARPRPHKRPLDGQ
ncbi:MAG: DUF6542 domain-containing protein [Carbonactinosporaceae bacterium]